VLANGSAGGANGDSAGGSGIDGGDLGGSDQKQADLGGAVGGLEARARADARILLHVAGLQRTGAWNPRLPKAPEEPLRNKTHWDHLLEEMNWLSTDVSNERKWKIKMAKLLSRDVLQYFSQRASEERRRARDDEQRMKRVALLAARGVRRFWRQIEKLVDYKHQSVLDHRKKRSMTKQLDFLVGQTERYSTMLAQNLTTSSKRMPVDDLGDDADDDVDDKLAATADDDDADDDDHDSVSWSDLSFEAHPSTRLLIANDSDDAATSTMTAANASTADTGATGAAVDDDDEFVPDERRRKLPASKRATDGDAATAHESDDHEDDDGIPDDESTIAAAELAERNDPLLPLAPGERETDLLLREQTMPIEQLLAHYRTSKRRRVGSSSGGGGGDDDDDDDADDFDADGDAPSLDKQEAADKARITAAASAASAVQPRGNTLAASDVRVAVPFLLRGQLREYQQVGLQWLATMCEKNLNGILADEMGLGKTIQTISLLAWLACERENWGPHLIVVPTSVMLNWEMEFRRWCPAFKIVTYYGSTKERKLLRRGWSRDNAFHVVITSYKLVTQDAPVFRRKKWQYFILDEAQNIKNYKSQRWQTLLNFNAAHRLLLTGTPLQNSLMELWSLMHFLMPDVFQSQSEFHEWFSNPLNAMVESGATAADVLGGGGGDGPPDIIARLHSVLRPFLLRRLKSDVEKQLPAKLHHVRYCSMSKRQRTLYEEFMARATTRATLDGGNFFGIVNVLMQLRKVCNHPDLFAPRPILSPFDMQPLQLRVPTQLLDVCETPALPAPLRLLLAELESEHTTFAQRGSLPLDLPRRSPLLALPSGDELARTGAELDQRRTRWRAAVASSNAAINSERLFVTPIYGAAQRHALCIASSRTDALLRHNESRVLVTELPSPAGAAAVNVPHALTAVDESAAIADTGVIARRLAASGALSSLLESTEERIESARDVLDRCTMMVSRARTLGPELQCVGDSAVMERVEASIERADQGVEAALAPLADALRPVYARRNVEFPDRRLVQFDCGKLQELADLLRELYSGGHRCLIFTQMTRMLDVLEEFLTLHGWVYVRLDGTTKLTERQALIERFNRDNRLFVFILSTRSGGFGLNLTGADTVIFYDSDWNPAMDAQAQDRCHRIGQTRDVHIYRLITRHTIEENILKKANQKRELDDLVIQGGQFTTEFFRDLDPRNLVSDDSSAPTQSAAVAVAPRGRRGKVRAVAAPEAAPPLTAEEARARQAEWEKAVAAAEDVTDATALREARRELRAYAAEYVDATQAGSSAAAEVAVATPGRVADEENLDEAPDEVIDEFASRLSSVQQYAVRFYEEIEPLRDYSGERAWHAERLRQAEASWAAASNAPANSTAAAADDDSAATTASFRPKRARVTFQDENDDDDTTAAATTTAAMADEVCDRAPIDND
jgi:SNF2 family DNA or RNA helicase